ncbi:T9SS type A sorting domain-containing protein [Flavobacteriaceae bacterium Ap0902]|nr:T9SS type A sorting domain-containing protein [Flavobacteriaceae bacterium Ap0902]
MKKFYFKNLSLAVVMALGLTSCNKNVESERIPSTDGSKDTELNINNFSVDSEAIHTGLTDTKKENHEIENSINPKRNVSIEQSPKGSNKTFINNQKYKKQEDRKIKGIEEIALYREQIAKGMGEKSPKYKKGYLVSEYHKAAQRLSSIKGNLKANYTVEFRERGPANVPGRARAIEVNPNNLNNWFIGTAGGGIWETNDGGTSWFNNTDYAIPNLATPSMDSPASNPDIIYAGTGEPYGHLDAIGGFGVVKSTNGGDSWELLESSVMMGDVGRLVVNPNDANMVVVASITGIYKTINGGATWSKTMPEGYFQDMVYEPGNFNVIYASSNGEGILKSTDAGDTWEMIFDAPAVNPNIARMEIDISPVNTDKIIIAAYMTGSTGYFLSNDAGSTFTQLTVNPGSDGTILNAQGWYDNALVWHPMDENVFYSGGIYMAKITINPATNNYTTKPIAGGYGNISGQINRYVHVDMQNIDYVINPDNPNEFRLILVCDGGVYFTDYDTDPGNYEGAWSDAAMGMNSTQFYGADKQNGANNYTAGAQDNGSWVSNTNNANESTPYIFRFGGDGFKALWNYEDTNRVLLSSQYNNFVNVNYQTGQGFYANHNDQGSANSPFYSKISNVNNNPNVVFSISNNGIWRTDNFGAEWELTPISDAWAPNGRAVSSFEVQSSVANPNMVWAGAAMTENNAFAVHISQDNGKSFNPIQGFVDPRSNFSHNYYLSGLATSSIDENRAYTLFSGSRSAKVLRTNDLGQTWEDLSGYSMNEDRGFPDVSVHALLEMPFDENIIWVGTDIGIFETLDGGASWHIIEDFIPVAVFDMKYVNDEVVISTHGRGIWTATIPELLDFELPNYVNPPSILNVSQAGIHDMRAVINFSYDSPDINGVSVFIDDQFVTTIIDDIAPNTEITYTTNEEYAEGTHEVALIGIYDNNLKTIPSNESGAFINFNDGISNFNIETFNDTDVASVDDYGFVVDNVNGNFNYNVLHNDGHPYENSVDYIAYLRTPFVNTTEGILTITHMALTEADYDFAIIEASTDLQEWVSIGEFSAASDSDWMNVNSSQVNESLFKKHDLDFSGDFAPNQEVVIRLRLTTDVYETAYGWLIKSLVNEDKLSVTDVSLEASSPTAKIVPNPVVDHVNIYLSNKTTEKVDVEIYDMTGRIITSQLDVTPISGIVSIPFKKLASGNYVAVIKTDDFTKSINFLKK